MQNLLDSNNVQINNPININDLADIRDVEIDPSLPVKEKKRSYLLQIKRNSMKLNQKQKRD